MGSRYEKIQSWVVSLNVYFAFSKPIPHFLTNSSGVTKWCLSFEIGAYFFLVIETLMFPIRFSTMISWANLIETFTIALSKSWMDISYWIYVTSWAQGFWLLMWLINLRLNTLLHLSSYIEDILRICFDGSQLCSSEIVMCRHVSIYSSVVYQVINPHVYSTINIGIRVLKYASIPIALCWLVRSSHIGTPKARHWLRFIIVFSIMLPKPKHWSKYKDSGLPQFHCIWGCARKYWDIYLSGILH